MKATFRAYFRRPAKNLRGNLPLILLLLSASCAPNKQASDEQEVIIRGSNTFGEELAPKLVAEYQKDHPGVKFNMEFKGTSYGLGALMVDKSDIAAASREATTNELGLAQDRSIQLNESVIGSYSVAVIVNSGNTLTNLTRQQVQDIFTGKVQNWKDLGGSDAPVHLLIRDPISGTFLGFQELAMDKKDYAQHAKTFTNYDGIVQAVAKDSSGIGYVSIEDGTKAGVKAISIGSVAPTVTTVQKGQYPYARALRLYTNKAKEQPTATDFIQFIESDRGQKVLIEMGFVPHA